MNRGYRDGLSCESPKVPSCTVLGALLFRMTHLYLHKNFFKSTFLSLYSGALTSLTLLKLNYIYLFIIINYPHFIKCVIANQLTGFYISLFLTVKGTSNGMTDFDCQNFQFFWKSQTCFINFSFVALKWLICVWCPMSKILKDSFLK